MQPKFPLATIAPRVAALLAALLLLAACAGPAMKKDIVRFESTYAKPPAEEGILYELSNAITAEHGPDKSGFRLWKSSHLYIVPAAALLPSLQLPNLFE